MNRRLFTPKAEKDTDDGQNPWAGLASYEDPATAERKLKFCGRDDDSYDVAKLIKGNIFVTLYGKSGIGKTSLLNAGVFPELREEHYSPLSIRLGIRDDDIIQGYQTVIIDAVNRAVSHIEEFDVIPVQEDQQSVDYLWKYFASHRFCDKDDNPTIPVVVFDQFEEVFRNNREEAETLLRQLDNCAVNGSSHRYEINIRFVVSIREDDLYRLEDSIDNCYLPALKRCRYRLRSLSEQGAKDAILIPGEGLFSKEEQEHIAQAIIGIARNKDDESISTNLLSLMCNRLYVESQKTSSSLISLSLIDSFVKTNLFERFYNEATRGFSSKEKSYIEEHLVDSTGRRNSIPESDFLTHVKNGERLLEGKNRILQRTSISSDGKNYRIELIHDSFCDPISELKQKREQKRKATVFATTAGIVLLCLGTTILILGQRDTISQRERELVAMNIELEMKNVLLERKNREVEKEKNVALLAIQERSMAFTDLELANSIIEQKNEELRFTIRNLQKANWEIKESQSVLIAKEAKKQIEKGNILYALRILLNVLPHGRYDKSRPYTADAEYYFRCAYDSLTTSKNKPIAILSGHTSYTRGISCSQDGKYIATCSNDKHVIVWDANSAKKIISIPAHKELVSSVNFSYDGKFVVSSSYDGTAKIWDVNTGELIREIGNVNNTDRKAWFATFDRKGDKLAISYDNSITIYYLRNQKEEEFPIQGNCPIAFSKDGNKIAFATENSISIIDMSNGKIKKVYDKMYGHFSDIKYSFDGKYLLVCGNGIKVLSTDSYEIVREFPNHGYYYCVDVSKDNRFILGCGHNNMHKGMDNFVNGDFNLSTDVCTIWDFESGEIICEHPGKLYAAFGNNNYRVYSTFDNYVYTWNFMGLDSLKRTADVSTFLTNNIDQQRQNIIMLKNNYIIVRDKDGRILLELKDRKYYNAIITADEKYLICCSDDDYYDESIWVWDLQRRNIVKSMRGFHSSISLQLNNNYLMASANYKTKHIIYETQTFEKIYEFEDVETPILFEDRIYFPKSKKIMDFFTLDVLISKCKNILTNWELTDEEKKELHLY